MKVRCKTIKFGRSVAILIPNKVVEELGLKLGDTVNFEILAKQPRKKS